MLRLLNSFMAVAGAAGIVWYFSSSSELWPALGYFSNLCVVGSVSAIAHYIGKRTVWLLAAGLHIVSLVLLVLLLVSALAISPGSGVAALVFVLIPLIINLGTIWRYIP